MFIIKSMDKEEPMMDGSCVTKINTTSVRSAAVDSEGQNRGVPGYRGYINRVRLRSISRVAAKEN